MTRVERYERRSEIPMMLLAVAFLIAYAVPVLDPDLDPDLRDSLTVLSWAVWAAFAVDFAIRLWLAEHRWDYAKRHWYDVALVSSHSFARCGCCGCSPSLEYSTGPRPGRSWAGFPRTSSASPSSR